MERINRLHIPMNTAVKRILFFSLFALFVLYTIILSGNTTNHKPGKEVLTPSAQEGKLVFQSYNCIACHQVYGLGGYMGPDLTNVISAEGKGEKYVTALLKHGTQRMPNFNLTETEIIQLTDYLIYLDKTGISPVRNFTLNLDGTFTSHK